MKQALAIRLPECMKARLNVAMRAVIKKQKRRIEEHLLCFGLAYAMFVGIFARVTIVPFESVNMFEIGHVYCYNIHKSLSTSTTTTTRCGEKEKKSAICIKSRAEMSRFKLK
jgi:hypothetical protein